MTQPVQDRADELFERALADAATRDPRAFYRERLKELKQADASKYDEAVTYYSDVLIPSIAEEEKDPLTAWQEYGARLAQWSNPGRAVEVDGTGRSHPHEPPAAPDRMVLHLPDGKGRAIVVALPESLTDAQRATYDWMVAGKRNWNGGGA